jgi:hypothetical protein
LSTAVRVAIVRRMPFAGSRFDVVAHLNKVLVVVEETTY